MNTAALKAFAPAVRRQLMEAVTRKLDFVLLAQTPDYLTTFASQVAALRKLAQADRSGLIERVAYTWFNRLTALRYLDARGWHPFRSRVLTAASSEETQPEILKLMRTGALPEELKQHADPARLNNLLDGHIPSPDPQGEVYRHLVLAACRFYHALLPDIFERLDDETELLLPDDLLTEHSAAQGFRTEITDDDCAEVEVIGWLYQFYISERKDEVMARKSAVPTEDIPAVTQLFTPHWIVRYLVENSLGRLWLLNRPDSRLREHMPYYIEGEPETDFLRIAKPQDIHVLDPASGSGHMLTYAFDLLTLIYQEEGYASTEIPALILRHNLYGLEICPRAAQLAELALVFKAREKSRRFFQPEQLVRPNIIELRDVRFTAGELREYIRALGLSDVFNEQLLRVLYQFEQATTIGSLIRPYLDEQAIVCARRAIEAKNPSEQLFLRETHLKILRVLEQAEMLCQRYEVVVANPPYMTGGMNGQLSQFVVDAFRASRSDLSATFIARSRQYCVPHGLCALVTMHSWMFLTTLIDFRKDLLSSCSILNLAHHGIGAFPTLNSKVVQTVAFILRLSQPQQNHTPICFRLLDYDADVKERQLRNRERRFATLKQLDFSKIEGAPIAYWISAAILESFRQNSIRKRYTLKEGLGTRNDPRFLRCFWEVSWNRTKSAVVPDAKWIKTDKAGAARKWYGNLYCVMNWENDGFEIKNYRNPDGSLKSRPQNTQYFFREAVTWGKVGTIAKTFRYRDSSLAFNDAAPSAFGKDLHYLLALLNSKVFESLLEIQGDTMNVTLGVVGILPFIAPGGEEEDRIVVSSSLRCVELARADWDSFETSWCFSDQPLLRRCLKGTTMEASWQNWKNQCSDSLRRMQELETANNRVFIDAYGLADELKPEVPEVQITLTRADARRDMAAFLSYAVGCMMGRYSLDHPGLILANAGDSLRDFLEKVKLPQDKLSFAPDEDGIIPVLDGEWFENDVVARVREFLRATFGESTLRENIRFIEESLGKDLRKYFLADFYKDHLQTYKKRPIYWMVQSPRRGFSVLVYLHRYTRDTMNLVLNRYLREYHVKLRNRLAHLAQVEANAATSPRDKTVARKEADKLVKTLHECEEWERQTVLPLAQARIELDLDDGVKVNYLKLGEALAPIPGLAAAEE
jgi:Eco57I restriction-modification methylase